MSLVANHAAGFVCYLLLHSSIYAVTDHLKYSLGLMRPPLIDGSGPVGSRFYVDNIEGGKTQKRVGGAPSLHGRAAQEPNLS